MGVPSAIGVPPPLTIDLQPSEEEVPAPPPPGQPLLSGWVRFFPSGPIYEKEPAHEQRVHLCVTDYALHVQEGTGTGPDEAPTALAAAGGPDDSSAGSLAADDVLAIGPVTPSPPPGRGYRLCLEVRKWSGPMPWLKSPRVSPLERPPPSPLRRGSESLLSLLSPLWRASRLSMLQRSSSLRRRQPSNASTNHGFEYVLELDTPWEAEAWAQAIAESREALVRAAAAERWVDVTRLLQAGRHPNGRESNGRSALHYAACHGASETVDELLYAGASACAVDHTGLAPLGMAALQSQSRVLTTLIAAGADPLLPAKAGLLTGKTAVDMARLVGCAACTSTLIKHSWLSLLPFIIQLRVVANLSPYSVRSCELLNSTWRQLILSGRQLGVLASVPMPPSTTTFLTANGKFTLPLLSPTPRTPSGSEIRETPPRPRASASAPADPAAAAALALLAPAAASSVAAAGQPSPLSLEDPSSFDWPPQSPKNDLPGRWPPQELGHPPQSLEMSDATMDTDNAPPTSAAAAPAPAPSTPPASPRLAPTDSCLPPPTIVLDLDETLVHASVAPTPKDDFSFSFLFGGNTHTMYVRRRPFLDRLLDALKDGPWEVVVFTASVRAYADKLLDVLDPSGKVFSSRLYREHCTPLEGCYTKDLRVLGRSLTSTILVENTPLSFCYQPANAILVPTWTTDDADTELLGLISLLEEAAAAEDVRTVLQRRCQMDELINVWQTCAMAEAAEAAALDVSDGAGFALGAAPAPAASKDGAAAPNAVPIAPRGDGQCPCQSPAVAVAAGPAPPSPGGSAEGKLRREDTSNFQTSAVGSPPLSPRLMPSLRAVA